MASDTDGAPLPPQKAGAEDAPPAQMPALAATENGARKHTDPAPALPNGHTAPPADSLPVKVDEALPPSSIADASPPPAASSPPPPIVSVSSPPPATSSAQSPSVSPALPAPSPPSSAPVSPPKSPAPEEEDIERPHQQRKHANDDIWDKKWSTRRKHIFVLTNTGRPIYCRYGDESKLSSVMGILATLVAVAGGTDGDTIRSVIAGDLKVVFLLEGPIYLVAVGRGDQHEALLRRQLSYVNFQLLSALTGGVHKTLTQRPNFDVRNTLGGADRFLDEIVYGTEQQISLQFNAVHMLRLEAVLRGCLTKSLAAAAHPDLTFGLVLSGYNLLQAACPANHPLVPSDIHIIMNTVNASPSFKSKESWTMICLPVFERRGFMYAYVSYITASVAVVLLSPKQGAFYEMAKCKKVFMSALAQTPEQLAQILELLETRASRPSYAVQELRVPSLLHFIYKDRKWSQVTSPALCPPYTNVEEAKRLKRRYQLLHHRVYAPASGPHKIYYDCTGPETVLVWQTFGFDLYAAFSPWETKSNCISGCNRLLNWIKQEEKSLFALNPPMY